MSYEIFISDSVLHVSIHPSMVIRQQSVFTLLTPLCQYREALK